jgi:hypothetical protein
MDVTGDAPPLAIDASQSVERAGWLGTAVNSTHPSPDPPPAECPV